MNVEITNDNIMFYKEVKDVKVDFKSLQDYSKHKILLLSVH